MYKGKYVNVVIPAAGSGKRMGRPGINKVFIELCGRTILERTVEAFETNRYVDGIVVAAKPDEVSYCRELLPADGKYTKLKDIVPGGKERCFSVLNALEVLEEDSIVLIHDAARSLIEDDLIASCIEAVYEHGCCAAGVPVKDTIKYVKDGFAEDTPDRSRLYAIQTPQGFFCGEIKNWMRKFVDKGFTGTDEAVFAEKEGKKVFIVEGKYDNIKITTSEDLIFAEGILLNRSKR